MPNSSSYAPLNWDDDAIELLSMLAPGDEDRARIWWATFAPLAYKAILDSGILNDRENLPRTEAEFNEWLKNQSEEDAARRRRNRALGLLIFFIGFRYVTQRNEVVTTLTVRGVLDSVLKLSKNETDSLCGLLREGKISLSDWQLQMAQIVKNVHMASAALQRGGFGRLSQDDWNRIQGLIDEQLHYLDNFANQISSGQQRLDGTLCHRMRLYLESGRRTYHILETEQMQERGMDEYRNVLGMAEHCPECVSETERGWVPIGDLVPIGERLCRVNCHCYYEFRTKPEG